MVHLTDEEMETHKNQRFCHICKQRFYDVNNSNGNSGKEFDLEKFHADICLLTARFISFFHS